MLKGKTIYVRPLEVTDAEENRGCKVKIEIFSNSFLWYAQTITIRLRGKENG